MADFDPAKARELAREARVVCDWRRTDTRPIGEPCPCYSCRIADQLDAACDEIDNERTATFTANENYDRIHATWERQKAQLAIAREALQLYSRDWIYDMGSHINGKEAREALEKINGKNS
jgi:hypothetical protein